MGNVSSVPGFPVPGFPIPEDWSVLVEKAQQPLEQIVPLLELRQMQQQQL
jgi:hypothetical protein